MAVSSWNDNGQKQFVHDSCKFIHLSVSVIFYQLFFNSCLDLIL